MTTTDKEYSGEGMGGNRTTEYLDSVLSSRRRRYLLYCLYLHSTPMGVSDIVDQIIVWECDDLSASDEEKRVRVCDSLYHRHLPALQDENIVEYDQRTDTVELGLATTRVESALNSYVGLEMDDLLEAEGQSMAHD